MPLIAVSFCLFGFILGLWAQSWEQLSIIPMLIVTPMTLLGGAFYSVSLATLDAAEPDLADAPIKFMDGANNNWWNAPAEVRHL